MKLINPEGQKKILVKENEKIDIFLEDFSQESREFSLEIEIQGNNSEVNINGRIHSQSSNKKVWNIKQIFLGDEQTGTIELRGVAENSSYLELNAQGLLGTTSTQATALIKEKILLFNDGKGQLLPVLTVKTDDVKKASHSASITPVKGEDLLFLSSRGISPAEAQDIIKKGFLN